MLTEEQIFREPSLHNNGFYYLAKSIFLVNGENFEAERCDNLTYAPVSPVYGTEFEKDACIFGKKSDYRDCNWTIQNVGYFQNIIDFSPDLFITYAELVHEPLLNPLEEKIPYREMEDNGSPSGLWVSHSIAELLKNIREWQIVSQEPFNVIHPMAEISNKFFQLTQPPKEVLDEIDSYPDMHLARFLKGDPNHRNHIDGFPQVSETVKFWFKNLMIQHPYKSFEERLNDAI